MAAIDVPTRKISTGEFPLAREWNDALDVLHDLAAKAEGDTAVERLRRGAGPIGRRSPLVLRLDCRIAGVNGAPPDKSAPAPPSDVTYDVRPFGVNGVVRGAGAWPTFNGMKPHGGRPVFEDVPEPDEPGGAVYGVPLIWACRVGDLCEIRFDLVVDPEADPPTAKREPRLFVATEQIAFGGCPT